MRLSLKSIVLAGSLLIPELLNCAYAGDNTSRGDTTKHDQRQTLEPIYEIHAGLDGEIYPVFANYASLQKLNARSFGVVAVSVSNPSDAPLRQRISVRIPGWSDQEIQITDVAAHSAHTFLFAPTFLPRFYRNHEITAATAQIAISDLTGHSVYESTTPVRLRSAEDMYWGADFKYAPFVASWVTPHNARVEALLAQAKRYTADRRLPGYESWKNPAQQEQETYREAEAIYLAVKNLGMSYVRSSTTLGDHKSASERIRMPGVSLSQSSANCIDAAVMYASLFENLGMDSTVLIVPGHAYAGVRVAAGSPKFLYIDVALTGRSTFAQAVASAETGLARYDAKAVTRVAIQEARSSGIFPMP